MRKRKAAEIVVKILVIPYSIAVLTFLSCASANPHPPAPPSPSPTATPTPAPSPTPVPLCTLPVVGDEWDIQPGLPTLAANVNVAMASITGCDVQSDCRVPSTCEAFFDHVILKLQEDRLCAGLARPGEDQIAVGADRCGWLQTYHVCNFGGMKVAWAPGSYKDNWKAKLCP